MSLLNRVSVSAVLKAHNAWSCIGIAHYAAYLIRLDGPAEISVKRSDASR
jgi:hypothetical protein